MPGKIVSQGRTHAGSLEKYHRLRRQLVHALSRLEKRLATASIRLCGPCQSAAMCWKSKAIDDTRKAIGMLERIAAAPGLVSRPDWCWPWRQPQISGRFVTRRRSFGHVGSTLREYRVGHSRRARPKGPHSSAPKSRRWKKNSSRHGARPTRSEEAAQVGNSARGTLRRERAARRELAAYRAVQMRTAANAKAVQRQEFEEQRQRADRLAGNLGLAGAKSNV